MAHLLVHGFYNVGLSNKFLLDGDEVKKQLYKFTYKFVLDLKCAFQPPRHDRPSVDVLFLCELGSMKDSIDDVFAERARICTRGGVLPPAGYASYAACDTVKCLDAYLKQVLQWAELEHLQVDVTAPYAVIWDPSGLSVKQNRRIEDLAERNGCWAVVYDVKHKEFPHGYKVASCHSPSSRNWQNLTIPRKQVVFNELARGLGARSKARSSGVLPPAWIIGGDLNTDFGLLRKWSDEFWDSAIPSANDPHALRVRLSIPHAGKTPNKGDIAVSQGFHTHALESPPTCCSDAHQLVLVCGWLASPASAPLPIQQRRPLACSDSSNSSVRQPACSDMEKKRSARSQARRLGEEQEAPRKTRAEGAARASVRS